MTAGRLGAKSNKKKKKLFGDVKSMPIAGQTTRKQVGQ